MSYTRKQLLKDAQFCDWTRGYSPSGGHWHQRCFRQGEGDSTRKTCDSQSDMSADLRDSLTQEFLKDLKVEVHTKRRVPGSDTEIEWDLEYESDGTQRMLELLGPI